MVHKASEMTISILPQLDGHVHSVLPTHGIESSLDGGAEPWVKKPELRELLFN